MLASKLHILLAKTADQLVYLEMLNGLCLPQSYNPTILQMLQVLYLL